MYDMAEAPTLLKTKNQFLDEVHARMSGVSIMIIIIKKEYKVFLIENNNR